MSDVEYGFALELTDFPRSYKAIAEALIDAANVEGGTCRHCRAKIEGTPETCPHCDTWFGTPAGWEPRVVDHVERAGALTRGLVDRYMVIDQLAIADVFMAMVGYLAQRTGRTPRQIHEDFFTQAPDDAWWRRKIEGDVDAG